jgi:hypothetical protein
MKKLLILPVALLFGCATGGPNHERLYPTHEPKLSDPNPAQAARYKSDVAECQRIAFASIDLIPRETAMRLEAESNQNAARAAATGMAMGAMVGQDLQSMAIGGAAGAALSLFLDAMTSDQMMGYGGTLSANEELYIKEMLPRRIDQCLRNRGYRLVEPGTN